MSLVEDIDLLIEAKLQKLTPGKVLADLKRFNITPSVYRDRGREIRSGVRASSHTPFSVIVRYDLYKDVLPAGNPNWSSEHDARFRSVLDALVDSGYTLVGNPLHPKPMWDPDEARNTALKTGVVGVVRRES